MTPSGPNAPPMSRWFLVYYQGAAEDRRSLGEGELLTLPAGALRTAFGVMYRDATLLFRADDLRARSCPTAGSIMQASKRPAR